MSGADAEPPRQTRRAPAVPPGIAAEMAAAGGTVTFARFMDLALTHPTEGYYSRAARLLGPRGHFSTAPRLSAAFNLAVCRLLEELVDELAGATAGPVALVELGAGEADLAKAVLRDWDGRRNDLRDAIDYSIVEVPGRLRVRQRRALAGAVQKGWRIGWTDGLPEAFGDGAGAGSAQAARAIAAFGNEFIDALPVHRVDVRGDEALETWVELIEGVSGYALRETLRPLSQAAEEELALLFGSTGAAQLRRLTSDGSIELRPAVGALLGELAATQLPVCLLTVDYGEWFAEAQEPPAGRQTQTAVPAGSSSAPERAPLRRRTIRGYFRHQTVADPYVRVGSQDLTADVDFFALDRHGRRYGFETVLFTSVAALLTANGAEKRLDALRAKVAAGRGTLGADREATVLAALLDEAGVGGAFKVMLQARE